MIASSMYGTTLHTVSWILTHCAGGPQPGLAPLRIETALWNLPFSVRGFSRYDSRLKTPCMSYTGTMEFHRYFPSINYQLML